MELVTITVPKALAAMFLEIAENCSQQMGNAGCNDLPIEDTTENLLLVDMAEAENRSLNLEAYRASDDYDGPPPKYKGKLYWQDSLAFDYFTSFVAKAIQ